MMLRLLSIKLRRKKLIWTMHDLRAPEESDRLLAGIFRTLHFWAVDGLIALSAVSYQMMIERYPSLQKKPFLLSWIGDYRTVYPNPPSKAEAKKEAGVGDEQ